jgi:hypothetical protein
MTVFCLTCQHWDVYDRWCKRHQFTVTRELAKIGRVCQQHEEEGE